MRAKIRDEYERNVSSGKWAYSDMHDAYYDTKTLEWVEPKCSDPACDFCTARPDLAPASTPAVDRRSE